MSPRRSRRSKGTPSSTDGDTLIWDSWQGPAAPQQPTAVAGAGTGAIMPVILRPGDGPISGVSVFFLGDGSLGVAVRLTVDESALGSSCSVSLEAEFSGERPIRMSREFVPLYPEEIVTFPIRASRRLRTSSLAIRVSASCGESTGRAEYVINFG